MPYSISLYTHIFSRGETWYLYNSQSNFFGKVSHDLIHILQSSDWESLDNDTINYLLQRHIIEFRDNIYNHFDIQHIKFNGRNYNPTVLGLVIAPTTACNFDCPYCFEPKLSPKLMTDKVINNLMSFIKLHNQAKSISLTWYGGEPLLAFKQIKAIYEGLKMDGIPAITNTTIVTNGSLIDEEICTFFREKRLNTMQITIDGNENSHNRTRCFKAGRKPSFDIIYRNIKMVRELIPDCQILIRVNINKLNLNDFVELYNKIKIDFNNDSMISVYPGIIREETEDGLSMTDNCITSKDLFDVYSYFRSQGINQSLFPEKKQRGCMIHNQNSYIIGPEGEIYKCWNDVSKAERVVGNISNTNLINQQLISRYMIGTTPFRKECRECKVFPICDSGCGYYQYKNLYENGRFDHCSSLKDEQNLEKALLEGSVTQISNISQED